MRNNVVNEIMAEIVSELERAKEHHPKWPTDIVHGAAVVAEEAGELVRAALQHRYEDGSIVEVRKEAVQTATTAIRLLWNLGHA